MATLEEFAVLIAQLGVNIEIGVTRFVRKVAIQIDQGLVLGAPVDTGRFRSNFLVKVGTPDRSVIEPYNPGKGLGKSEGGNAQRAIAQGLQAIGTYKGGEGVGIFISNNVDYAAKLADGGSKQARKGWMTKVVRTAVAAVRGTRIISNGKLVI